MEGFFFFPMDIPEIIKIIMALKDSAAGFDDINTNTNTTL